MTWQPAGLERQMGCCGTDAEAEAGQHDGGDSDAETEAGSGRSRDAQQYVQNQELSQIKASSIKTDDSVVNKKQLQPRALSNRNFGGVEAIFTLLLEGILRLKP